MPRGGGRIAYLATLAGMVAFGIYVERLCPDLCLRGDSAELVTAAALWGVPHPPGYPIFTAVGHLFAALPWHTVPWRVHLTSAVYHAGAVAATAVAGHALTRSRVGAMAAATALALSRSFVLGSLYAEVFPLNDLFFACLLAIGLRLRCSATRSTGRALWVLAAVSGLASAHHMMIALAAPALSILVFLPARRLHAEGRLHAPTVLLAFVLPLVLAYALVPMAAARSPYLSWGEVHDVRSLVQLATRQDYGGLWSPARQPTREPPAVRVFAFARLVYEGMGVVVVVGALAGLGLSIKRSTPIGAALLFAVLLPGPAFAWANAIDVGSPEGHAYLARFTTMCQVPLAIAFGVAVAHARDAFRRSPLALLAGALACAIWAWMEAARSESVDLRADAGGIGFAHDLILATPERSLVLLTGDQPANAALYVCGVERLCGDRAVMSPGSLILPWRRDELRRRYPDVDVPWAAGPGLRRTHELAAAQVQKRPVFAYPDLLSKDPELQRSLTCLPDGLLFRVWPPATDASVERREFLASADRLLATGCEGCGAAFRASMGEEEDFPLGAVYGSAYANHARAARRLGAEDLALRLEARRDYGARSMSR